MNLSNILGFIGDHAYRASALSRASPSCDATKRELAVLMDAMHEALPAMLEVLGTAPAAPKPPPPSKIPAPKPPKPPQPPQTVGEDMKELKRQLARVKSKQKKAATHATKPTGVR